MFAFKAQKNTVLTTILLVVSVAFALTFSAHAQFNPTINYQGKLTDSSNSAVVDGTYEMEFSLYTASSGGTPVWTETLSGGNEVTITNGIFSVMLGSVTPLTSVDFNQTLYLGVTIEADPEMTPRKILGTVPAAFEAENAQTVGNIATSSFLRSDQADTLEATTASSLLSIVQNGTGNILSLFDGGTEVFTVRDGGNVGIGTSTPTETLDVHSSDFAKIRITGSTAAAFVTDTTSGISKALALGAGTLGSVFNFDESGFFAITSDAKADVTDLSGDTRLYIDGTTGKVGIGTENANQKLTIFNNNADTGIEFSSGIGKTWAIGIDESDASKFKISSSSDIGTNDRFVIDSEGNIGIGTASPSQTLHVAGNARITGSLYDSNNTAGLNGMVLQTTGSGTQWVATSTLGFGTSDFSTASMDTYAELNAIVADVTLTHNGLIDTSAELLALVTDATGTGNLVFSASPTFTGTITGAAATLSSTLTMSGSSANIALGSNYLSGDGSDEGIYIDGNGNVGISTTAPGAKLDVTTNGLGETQTNTSGILLANTTEAPLVYGGNEISPALRWRGNGTYTTSPESYSSEPMDFRAYVQPDTETGKLVFESSFMEGAYATRFSVSHEGYAYVSSRLGIGMFPSQELTVDGDAYITGRIYDSTNSAGTNGMVLQSTGSGFNWVATSTLGFGTSDFSTASMDTYVELNAIVSDVTLTHNGLIDTSAELLAIVTDATGTGNLVFSNSPTLTGTLQAAAATLSSTLTMSGSAANIALGSNYLSGDGDDEGIYIDGSGNVGIGTSSPLAKLHIGSGANGLLVQPSNGTVDELIAFSSVNRSGSTGTNHSQTFIQNSVDVDSGSNNRRAYFRHVLQGDYTTDSSYEVFGMDFYGDSYWEPQRRGAWLYTSADLHLQAGATEPTLSNDEVASSTNAHLTITAAGNVGIGTLTPSALLDVNGNININSDGTFSEDNMISITGGRAQFGHDGNSGNAVVQGGIGKGIEFNVNNGTFGFGTAMTILSSGNVGIGNTSPSALLTIGGSFGDVDVEVPSNSSFRPADNDLANNPAARYTWHDLFAFSTSWGVPTYERYNGSWSADTVDPELFAQKDFNASYIFDGTTHTGARWTWSSGNIPWSRGAWLAIGFTYETDAGSKGIHFESSANGTDWTTRHISTTTANSYPEYFYLDNYGGDSHLRLTITSVDPVELANIRLLSSRQGDQGRGKEFEVPYTWDGAKNMTFSGNLTMSGYAANVILGNNWLSGDGGDEGIFVNGSGNVGVGTSTPQEKFSVNGDISFGDLNNNWNWRLQRSGVNNGLVFQGRQAGGAYNSVMTLMDASGNVGIGTTTPQYKLSVVTNSSADDGLKTGAALHLYNQAGSGETGIVTQSGSTGGDSWFTGLNSGTSMQWAYGSLFQSSATKLTLTTSGNLGIGSTAPGSILTLDRSGENALKFEESGTSRAWVGVAGGFGQILPNSVDNDLAIRAEGNVLLGTGYNTRMFINTSGNIGIGTVTPNAKLSIHRGSDSGFASAATIVNDASIGTTAWSLPSNAGNSDNVYATGPSGSGGQVYDQTVKLVKGGTIGGNDKSYDTQLPYLDEYRVYGGSNDLWGNTLTPADVNASNFGVALTVRANSVESNYLKATNFGISVPSGATVEGVVVEVEYSRGTGINSWVDHIRLKVFYSTFNGDTLFAVEGSSNSFIVDSAGNVGIGTTTPESLLSLHKTSGLTGSVTAGLSEYFNFTNSTESAVYYGDNAYIVNAPTATSTLVGNMLRVEDTSVLGNTVRGLEVQAHQGTNTQGENTGISAFGRTFGIRGTTEGDAGGVFQPAGVFAQTRGTTQGNAIRAYSASITTEDLVSLFQDTSTFAGTGLLMNFGNSGGSFSSSTSKFVDFQNSGTSKFTVTAHGTTTIGDGTTANMAGLQIGYGGLCVDNDGTCVSNVAGKITSVSSGVGNSDLAEMYFGDTDLEPGEIIATAGILSIERADSTNATNVIGVVSTKPGLTLGYDDTSLTSGQTGYPVALSGRVPVKLSTENGPIKAGDKIMLSSIPGIGMKATGSGTVVGTALEDFDGDFAYSEGFIDQFGDDIAEPNYDPLSVEEDERINDGCYFGAGGALGEDTCDPKDTDRFASVQAAASDESEDMQAALLVLAQEDAEEMETPSGMEVSVGQALMFVNLGWHPGNAETLLSELTSTSTDLVLGGDGEETLWDRVKALAQGFVDGVLTITGLRAENVYVENELCVDGVCVTADDLRALLDAANRPENGSGTGEPPAPPPPSEPEETPPPEEEEEPMEETQEEQDEEQEEEGGEGEESQESEDEDMPEDPIEENQESQGTEGEESQEPETQADEPTDDQKSEQEEPALAPEEEEA